MKPQVLGITTADSNGDRGVLRLTLQMQRRCHEVYFKTDDVALTPSVEAFLALTLVPAMKQGLAVPACGPVSQRLLDATETIMNTLCTWDPSLHRVDIQGAIPVEKDSPTENRVGVYFSGGVDSFYTLLKHRDEITDLIFVHGFDLGLDNSSRRQRASKVIREVGSALGKNVIEIETNIRAFLRPYISYAKLGHGAAMAGVGHLLAPCFRRLYIASSHRYGDLFPWGSHPELDPLWSTETLQFVHDGCEATRIDKAALLATSDVALRSLRICGAGRTNCGRCEKCVRTMINLAAVDALDRCTSFDVPLSIRNVEKILVDTENTRAFLRENLEALENSDCNRPLYDAMCRVAGRPRWRTKTIQFARQLRRKTARLPTKLRKGWAMLSAANGHGGSM